MSVKLDIFNDIVAAVEKIAEVETARLWNNQLGNEGTEIPFNFAAVFIEFALIPWTSTNQKPSTLGPQGNVSKEQKGKNAVITIHISFSKLEDETVSFPIISPIIDSVYFAVQDLSGEFYSALRRIEERQDTDHNRVIDWQMDFTCELFQCGEEDDTLTEIPGGTVDVDVTIDLDIDNDIIRTGDSIP